MTVKLRHYTEQPADTERDTFGSVTYKNIAKLIAWLEDNKRRILELQNMLWAISERVDKIADELDEMCDDYDAGREFGYPIFLIMVPFNILEYNRGLVFQDDHTKHPTLELMASVHVRMHVLEVFVSGREYPTFTFKYEEEQ